MFLDARAGKYQRASVGLKPIQKSRPTPSFLVINPPCECAKVQAKPQGGCLGVVNCPCSHLHESPPVLDGWIPDVIIYPIRKKISPPRPCGLTRASTLTVTCFDPERDMHESVQEPPTVRDGPARGLARRIHDRQGRGPPGVRLGDDEVPYLLKEPISVNVSCTSRLPRSTTTCRRAGPDSPATWHECRTRLWSEKALLELAERRNRPMTTGRDIARASKMALRLRRPTYYINMPICDS